MKLIIKIHLSRVNKIFMDLLKLCMMLVCCKEVRFSLPPELSFCSVYFVFSSLLYYFLLQQYPLCYWPFLNRSWSLPEQCGRVSHISTAQNLVNFSIENQLFSVFPTLCLQPCIAQSSISSSSGTCHLLFQCHIQCSAHQLSTPKLSEHPCSPGCRKCQLKAGPGAFFLFCSTFRRTSSLAVSFQKLKWHQESHQSSLCMETLGTRQNYLHSLESF